MCHYRMIVAQIWRLLFGKSEREMSVLRGGHERERNASTYII